MAPPRRVMPPVEELRRRYVDDKETLRTLSRHYRVGMPAVTRWLHAAGIEIRSRRAAKRLRGTVSHSEEWLAEMVPSWCAAFTAGESISAIATRYEVSHDLVRTRLRRAGLTVEFRRGRPRTPWERNFGYLYPGDTVVNAATGQQAVIVAEHGPALTLRFPDGDEAEAAATDWEVVCADIPPLPPVEEPA